MILKMLDAKIASVLRRFFLIPLSEEESVLKSRELRNTTDSSEEGNNFLT